MSYAHVVPKVAHVCLPRHNCQGHRLSDKHIISARPGFIRARNHGEKAISKGVIIQAVRHDNSHWRYGLTATKKIGNAVIRNRVRRRLRAIAKQVLAPLAMSGVDYVLIGRATTATSQWAELINEVEKSLRYLHRKLGDAEKQG
ncbi:MAG: ribonuclease P protein component [Candidatus Puniceispirillum sp.]|nr:ribonuclease P protein component [Candidatus Puniceispirillum sp.]MBT6416652.1 ribonuclease P protein component [Candidatus Puniceispirillum sp.]MBT6567167.1 ribonuclease P protein component [Candidatus Puniceispirillum sp.]